MTNNPILIAVGQDDQGWHTKFIDAIKVLNHTHNELQYLLVNLDQSNWLEQIADSNLVLWRPAYMGHEFTGYMKEKIYFLENFMGKLVVPNFSTIWHYESKIAQSFLFKNSGIHTPKTVVSFDLDETLELSEKETFPVVWKKSAGASSSNVRYVSNMLEFQRLIRNTFSLTLFNRSKWKYGYFQKLISLISNDWFRDFILRKHSAAAAYGVAYWQEFIHNNTADLRITVIGDRFAFGFWRNNRAGDFRASGSGLIDYIKPIPEEALHLCLNINRKLHFDSMAYDILFKDDSILISEISYTYSDQAIHNASGYYFLEPDGGLRFLKGNTWPQMLWVEWALIKARGEKKR